MLRLCYNKVTILLLKIYMMVLKRFVNMDLWFQKKKRGTMGVILQNFV